MADGDHVATIGSFQMLLESRSCPFNRCSTEPDPFSCYVGERVGAKDRTNNLWMAEGSAASTTLDRCQLASVKGLFTHCKHHKGRKQQSVQAEVPAELLRVDPGVHNEDPGVEARGRNRRPAALEDQETGVQGFGHGQGSGEVGGDNRARQAPTGPPGTDGGHACAHRVLYVVTGSMAPGFEKAQQDAGVELRPGVD